MADPRTLILRFVDFEEPTIALHQEILAQDGQVWWAWWRKSHEDQRLEVLGAVAKNLPVTLGLVNRRSEEFFKAQCVKMELAGVDEKIPSPDPSITPDYYSDEEYPAWFLFQEIKEISREEWDAEFAGFGEPTGDDSLYWIDEAPEPHEPSSEIPVYESGAPGELILHISDLHYGEDHGYELDGDQLEKPSMRQIIVDSIREGGEKVGVLIVSGDITTGGDYVTLQAAALPEIKGLAEDLELALDNVIVIPGNHDIKLNEAEPGSYKHERGFRTFLDQLFGEGKREPDALFTFETPEGRTLNFATLNSVRLSKRETRQYGYVGRRSKYVFDALAARNNGRDYTELAEGGILNFLVLHHHLISGALTTDPPPKGPVSLTLDAGRIIAEAQEAAVHVALHGHEHLPFIGSAARQEPLEQNDWDGYKRPLMVIGGGSAGAKLPRLPTRKRENTFGLYKPVDGGLEVSVFEFNEQMKPHPMMRTTLELAPPSGS